MRVFIIIAIVLTFWAQAVVTQGGHELCEEKCKDVADKCVDVPDISWKQILECQNFWSKCVKCVKKMR